MYVSCMYYTSVVHTRKERGKILKVKGSLKQSILNGRSDPKLRRSGGKESLPIIHSAICRVTGIASIVFYSTLLVVMYYSLCVLCRNQMAVKL